MEKFITGYQWSPSDGKYIGEYQFPNNLDKEDIHLPPNTTLEKPPIAPALQIVEKLNPVTYRYKEDWSKDQSTQPGFIAQELLTALEGTSYVDGVVTQGGAQGYYSVAYQNLIPVLTKPSKNSTPKSKHRLLKFKN